MNALYGKMLQNPISDSEAVCKTMTDIQNFAFENIITNWEVVENENNEGEYVLMVGNKRSEENVAKKPRQLGSFILANSRDLWLKFLKTCNNDLTEYVSTYQDTDSLHIHGKYHKMLIENNLIDSDKLGYLDNDCDNDALIFSEINLAPKCYNYKALDKDGNIITVMKSKGIMKNQLVEDWYVNHKFYQELDVDDERKPIATWDGLKKIHKNISKKDRDNGVSHFSIKSESYKRTFYRNEWTGMNLINNKFLPFGHK